MGGLQRRQRRPALSRKRRPAFDPPSGSSRSNTGARRHGGPPLSPSSGVIVRPRGWSVRRPSALAVLVMVMLAGCVGSTVSPAGQKRCRVEQERDANPLIRLLNERRCRATVDQRLALKAQRQRQERADQVRRSQRETERCRQRAGAIALELRQLRQAEARLAAVRGEAYAPSPPPAPFNEAAEARFRFEDQELDRQRHGERMAVWQAREDDRRRRWHADHASRLEVAQITLNQRAAAMRQQQPDLFSGPTSIELNGTVWRRLQTCPGPDQRRSISSAAG